MRIGVRRRSRRWKGGWRWCRTPVPRWSRRVTSCTWRPGPERPADSPTRTSRRPGPHRSGRGGRLPDRGARREGEGAAAGELPLLRRDHLLFCFLHLAAGRELAAALCGIGLTAVAFETVQEPTGLPLLAPMSDIAGRLAVQIGAHLLHRPQGGRGLLLGGLPGAPRGRVVVLGAATPAAMPPPSRRQWGRRCWCSSATRPGSARCTSSAATSPPCIPSTQRGPSGAGGGSPDRGGPRARRGGPRLVAADQVAGCGRVR